MVERFEGAGLKRSVVKVIRLWTCGFHGFG